MIQSILSIIAAILPLVIDIVQLKLKDNPYDDKQKLRKALNSGDTDIISLELDRLREKARGKGLAGGQPSISIK